MKPENCDIIKITKLKAATIIGVNDWERQVKQNLYLDVELACDAKQLAESDDIEQALDYTKVASTITQFIETSQFKLIETLVECTAQQLLKQFNISWLRLVASKIGVIANAEKISVVIERTANT